MISRRKGALHGATGHWVHYRDRCRTALLSTKKTVDLHSGENLCKNILSAMNEYNSRGQIGHFVTDKAFSKDTALKE